MKVGIACTGIGQVQRGFERYFRDLFREVRRHVDATLFKGGGETGDGEEVVGCARRTGKLTRFLPVHVLVRRTRYEPECLTFAWNLHRRLKRESFDLVHVIDPPLCRYLFWIRKAFGGDYRILYTEGCAMPPQHYPPADHTHHVGHVAWQEALDFGIDDEAMTLIPCGLHSERFQLDAPRERLRRKYGIPADTFVILSVASIDRRQKRIHHLIEEVARLEGDCMLWIDGSMDPVGDPTLLTLGQERLGDRCRFTHVASEDVRELYRVADVKVLASLHESFALAVVEALVSGLPVVTHDSDHFRWLVGNAASLVDMEAEGALGRKLAGLLDDREALAHLRNGDSARERFDWARVVRNYVDLYHHVAGKEALVPA